ncbi:MAG: glycosyltransferase family 2 protein [Prevotella sp.]|nr:glycosyltransferase family 2 protein [Prevotella sp.]
MKISIVIPVYNVAPYIEDCLRSVMNQTWQDSLECILVDDCGTDESMRLIEQMMETYTGKVDFRIIRHPQNRGLSAARNSGIDAATGDYVFFLDSDDEITPDCIERLTKPLQDKDYDFVVGGYQIIGSQIQMDPLRLKDGAVLDGDEVLKAYRVKDWYLMSVNKLYQVSFLNRHHLRFQEGIIHEDELWSFQIACLAKSLYAVGHVTYLYKIREGSITVKKNYERSCTCINLILKEMCNFSRHHHLEQNQDVHNLIQNFQMITLNSLHTEAPSLFRSFYAEQRRVMTRSWRECSQLDGVDIRKQLRDLHLLLPIPLAVTYLKLLFRFM